MVRRFRFQERGGWQQVLISDTAYFRFKTNERKGARILPRILQFGTGRFLRGFFDCVVDQPKSITVVQSRPNSEGAELINDHPGGYHVWTRGKNGGRTVDEFEIVNSIDRAIVASRQWDELVRISVNPDLRLIVSNTTEKGLALDTADDGEVDYRNQCPASFPARLLAILHQRYVNGCDGVAILPMELVEFNATRLLALVTQQARVWSITNDEEFLDWIGSSNRWLNNLVDRIVVNVSDTPPWHEADPLAVVAEPYRLLAIENDGLSRDVLPDHEMIHWVDDLQRLFLRKVRILNGLHTAMVGHSMPRGFDTVLEAVSDSSERAWLESILHDEILPALAAKGIEETEFAKSVFERFENPFFQHRLEDIANGHEQKLRTRIMPTIDDFQNAFGNPPEKLTSLAGTDVNG